MNENKLQDHMFARGIYLGIGSEGAKFSAPQRSVLVLGPPRSGKTTCLIVPDILSAAGPVVSTSTKSDVMEATFRSRSERGQCYLYDPSGTVEAPTGVNQLRWSPVPASSDWDSAMLISNGLVGAVGRSSGGERGGGASDHWSERSQALIASLLHGAALGDCDMRTVLSWVDRRQSSVPLRILESEGAKMAADLLSGIAETDAREQSGIWSTASGVLSAYRSESALRTTDLPNFDAPAFCNSASTLYICGAGRNQHLVAPLVVGLIAEVRSAAYSIHRRNSEKTPVLMALDEVANIAPLPDLPSMVSEGGGQGVLTVACLQDLSQARRRWGAEADGFLSLFGTTVVLPGIGDVRTLKDISDIAGDREVETTSLSQPIGGGPRALDVAGRALLGRPIRSGAGSGPSFTVSTVRVPSLSVDQISRGASGAALVLDESNRTGWIKLTPWYRSEPWLSAVSGPNPDKEANRQFGMER